MKRLVRHTTAESARQFQKAAALLSAGATIPEVCRKLGVSEATFHRWRRKFAPPSRASPPSLIPRDGSSRLKQLEKENKRLKLLVAELTLENAFLKDRLEGANG